MATTPQKQKWVDPRIPVLVEKVGNVTVTIYDMEAYNASLLRYPDSNDKAALTKSVKHVSYPLPVKAKPSARYQWTKPLEKPLALTTHVVHTTGKG